MPFRASTLAVAFAALLTLPAFAQTSPSGPGAIPPVPANPAAAAAAQDPGATGGARDEGAAATVAVPPAAAAPAGAFDPAAATEAYLARVPAADRERSDAYFEGGYWLLLWNLLWGLAVAGLLLGTRLSARMRDFAERTTRFRTMRVAIYAALYTLAGFVLSFPLSLYQGYFREHRYGLSNQTLGAWLGDQAKGLLLGLVLGSFAIVLLYAVLRRAPRTWWLWGAVVVLALLAVSVMIAPVYIAPLFNDYTRLEDPAVRDPILDMASAHGVPVNDVWVFDASRQTKRISANVSGFLGTERISLNDNLLERTSLPEIQSVMGHELGHYVLGHVYEMFVELGVLVVLGFAFLRLTFERTRRRWGHGWGVRGVDDPAGLPLLAALLSVWFFLIMPLTNTIIRSNEAEADAFGLAVARQPDGFAEVALKLGEYRKLDPGPVEEWLFFDHPSGRARIRRAMEWKAAQLAAAEREAGAGTGAAAAAPGATGGGSGGGGR